MLQTFRIQNTAMVASTYFKIIKHFPKKFTNKYSKILSILPRITIPKSSAPLIFLGGVLTPISVTECNQQIRG